WLAIVVTNATLEVPSIATLAIASSSSGEGARDGHRGGRRTLVGWLATPGRVDTTSPLDGGWVGPLAGVARRPGPPRRPRSHGRAGWRPNAGRPSRRAPRPGRAARRSHCRLGVERPVAGWHPPSPTGRGFGPAGPNSRRSHRADRGDGSVP